MTGGGGSAERYVTPKIIYMYNIYYNLYHVYVYLYIFMSCIAINICYIRVWYLVAVALYPMYYPIYKYHLGTPIAARRSSATVLGDGPRQSLCSRRYSPAYPVA